MSNQDTNSATALLKESVQVQQKNHFFIDRNWQPFGITEQFLEDAETYHQRYFSRLDFVELTDYSFTLADIKRNANLQVLDIGSGGGSSVFSSAKLLPNASICASDISPELLDRLANFVESQDDLKNRISVYCFDLHVPFFRDNSFDLINGYAILHHLVDPYAALKNVASSLKTGGKIILVEPLEAGSLILVSLYEKILKVLHQLNQETGALANLMRALRLDIQARLGVPVCKPWTAHLDDKWVFDDPYLLSLAEQLQMSSVDVYPAQADLSTVFESAFRSVLADSGNGQLPIPPEVLAVLQEFDQGMSASLKQKFCPTGIIIFTK